MSRTRITKTLLNSWLWVFKKDDGWEDFLRTINREKTPPTEAQLAGLQYEATLNAHLNGDPIPTDHKWHDCITYMADELWGAAQQVTLYRPITVDGEDMVVHGVLDFLKAGHIWDCKFSQRYASHNSVNAYMGDTQHSAYLYLVPESRDFTYFISDGSYVYRERYTPDETTPIEYYIHNFLQFIKLHGLYEVYKEKWRMSE